MKKLEKYSLILALMSLNLLSCNQDSDYSIKDKYIIKPSDCSCDISYRYPEIISNNNLDSNLIALNNALKLFGEYERFIEKCNPDSPRFMESFQRFECDYKITLQTDTILSVEIFNTAYYDNDFKYTRFNSFVVNPNNWTEIRLEELFDGLDRGKIYPFIAEYNRKTDNNINLLAYESNSKYVLTYGITKDNLIIYVGGEGEWFGNDKVLIPIKELRKE